MPVGMDQIMLLEFTHFGMKATRHNFQKVGASFFRSARGLLFFCRCSGDSLGTKDEDLHSKCLDWVDTVGMVGAFLGLLIAEVAGNHPNLPFVSQ